MAVRRRPAPAAAPDRYRAYGLAVESRLALPCPRDRAGAADVVLTPAPRARFDALVRRRPPRRRRWFEHHELDDGSTFLRWRGLSDFLISPDGSRIEYRRDPRTSPESLTTYLLGQVLSFSLLARGVEPLHGTVVSVGGRAVALLGDCGLGKSTLAAALLARGCPIVTDDLIVTRSSRGRVEVWPGLPRLKLYPRVARALLGESAAASRMNRGSVKIVVPLHRRQSVRQRLPLHGLFVLDRSDRGIAIDRLRGSEALIETLRATFNDIVIRRPRIAAQFEFASRLVSAVPVYRLTYPRRLADLPKVCEAIVAHVLR